MDKGILRIILIIGIIIGGYFYFKPSAKVSSNEDSGTYIEYPNLDKRITRTYTLNSNGSATVTFKSVIDFSNRTETDTKTEYGYWEKGNGYIKVVYDDNHAFLDLGERKVYHGYTYYRSRQGGCEFEKQN